MFNQLRQWFRRRLGLNRRVARGMMRPGEALIVGGVEISSHDGAVIIRDAGDRIIVRIDPVAGGAEYSMAAPIRAKARVAAQDAA